MDVTFHVPPEMAQHISKRRQHEVNKQKIEKIGDQIWGAPNDR